MENVRKYETGATSHAVNDLILFAENTRQLAQKRDNTFREILQSGSKPRNENFLMLYYLAQKIYCKQLPEGCEHIIDMEQPEKEEFCSIYVGYYEDWKHEQNAGGQS